VHLGLPRLLGLLGGHELACERQWRVWSDSSFHAHDQALEANWAGRDRYTSDGVAGLPVRATFRLEVWPFCGRWNDRKKTNRILLELPPWIWYDPAWIAYPCPRSPERRTKVQSWDSSREIPWQSLVRGIQLLEWFKRSGIGDPVWIYATVCVAFICSAPNPRSNSSENVLKRFLTPFETTASPDSGV